jgi:hypothetical protein
MLKKQNRFQVPVSVRWEYRLERCEILRVIVSVVNLLGARESFLAKIQKNGCIEIPKFMVALLKRGESSIEGYAIEVTLEPA